MSDAVMLVVCRHCNQPPHGFRTKALKQYSNVGDMAGLGWLIQRVRCTACRGKKVTGYKSPWRAFVKVFLATGKGAFVDEEEAFGIAVPAQALVANAARAAKLIIVDQARILRRPLVPRAVS
jgi:hypothetical protein